MNMAYSKHSLCCVTLTSFQSSAYYNSPGLEPICSSWKAKTPKLLALLPPNDLLFAFYTTFAEPWVGVKIWTFYSFAEI